MLYVTSQQEEEKNELILQHRRSKKYFMFPPSSQTWHFSGLYWKHRPAKKKNRGSSTCCHLIQIFVRCNRSANTGCCLNISMWVVRTSLLLKFDKANLYYCIAISQAILDVSWLIDLQAQTSSNPLRPEAGNTICFHRCCKESKTTLILPTMYEHTILGVQVSSAITSFCDNTEIQSLLVLEGLICTWELAPLTVKIAAMLWGEFACYANHQETLWRLFCREIRVPLLRGRR